MDDRSSSESKGAWKIGDVLAGRYEITGLLGSGGMGKVFKAWDQGLGREVAVKTLTSAGMIEQEVVRFQREAQAASQLRHASVIDCYDFGILDSGQPYMVMEYIDGVTLKNVLRRDGALEADYVLSILERLTDGLAAIHRAGIVHRDLNSGNIMIVETEIGYSVKILDFGIARREYSLGDTTLTRKDTIIGNPLYMSPEQARGEAVDERSDIYSLGCIAFELLSGVPPFRAGNVLATIRMHTDNEAPPLDAVLTRDQPCVELLDRLVQRALSKDPAERYQSAEEFKEEIVRVRRSIEDAWVSENRETQIRTLRKKKPTWRLAVVAATGIGALVLVAIFTLQQAWSDIFPPPKKPKKLARGPLFTDTETGTRKVVDRQYENESDELPIPEKGPVTGKVKTRLYSLPDGLAEFHQEVASGAQIDELLFKRVKLSNDDVKLISKLHPTKLWFFGTGLDDQSLLILSKIKNLQDLRMCEERKVTSTGLKSLSRLSSLWMLVLFDMNLKDQDMDALRTFPALQQINVEMNRQITKKGLETLAKCKTLKQIAIAGCACSLIPASKVRAFEAEHNLKLHTDLLWRDPEKEIEALGGADRLF